MKVYTKEMFLIAAEKCEVSMIDAEHIMNYIDEYVTPIELPMQSTKTAVEWLFLMLNNPNRDQGFANKLLDQAKQIEKEQIKMTWIDGKYFGKYFVGENYDEEQYYNEIYNQNK